MPTVNYIASGFWRRVRCLLGIKKIEFSDDFVRIITDHHPFDLDLREIDKKDIEQAKTFLNRMNFNDRFEIRDV